MHFEQRGPAGAADAAQALTTLYREAYAEPPYNWGEERAALFAKRFEQQRQAPGFDLIVANAASGLVGFSFGVTLLPDTPWRQNLTTDLDSFVTEEYSDRTFALVELMVAKPWRHCQGAARPVAVRPPRGTGDVDRPTCGGGSAPRLRQMEMAPGSQKRNPSPGSPVFDVMVKELLAN